MKPIPATEAPSYKLNAKSCITNNSRQEVQLKRPCLSPQSWQLQLSDHDRAKYFIPSEAAPFLTDCTATTRETPNRSTTRNETNNIRLDNPATSTEDYLRPRTLCN